MKNDLISHAGQGKLCRNIIIHAVPVPVCYFEFK